MRGAKKGLMMAKKPSGKKGTVKGSNQTKKKSGSSASRSRPTGGPNKTNKYKK